MFYNFANTPTLTLRIRKPVFLWAKTLVSLHFKFFMFCYPFSKCSYLSYKRKIEPIVVSIEKTDHMHTDTA